MPLADDQVSDEEGLPIIEDPIKPPPALFNEELPIIEEPDEESSFPENGLPIIEEPIL